jgi:hypothetical protein
MTAPLHDCVATNAVHVLIPAAISDAADIDTSAESGLVDPRLALLARAHARFILDQFDQRHGRRFGNALSGSTLRWQR